MSLFLSQFINGLSISAIYFISAIGLVIILGMLGVVNLALGEMIMVGAYSAYIFSNVLGLPFFMAMIASFLVTGALGAVMEVFLIKRMYGRVAETLLITFACSYIIQQIMRILFGPEEKFVNIPIPQALNIGKVTVPLYNMFIVLCAVLILLGTYLLFFKTTLGLQIRSITQNRTMTTCLGINSRKIDTITFAYGTGLAGLAGCLISPIKSVSPQMGLTYTTDALVTVVLGGLSNFMGCFASAYVIGESVTLMAGYISEVIAKVLVFLLCIIIIRFRPEGLFTVKDRR